MASFRFNVGSRSLTLGALLTAVVGVLASIPLVGAPSSLGTRRGSVVRWAGLSGPHP